MNPRNLMIVVAGLAAAFAASVAVGQSRRDFGRDSSRDFGRDSGRDSGRSDRSSSDRSSFDRFGSRSSSSSSSSSASSMPTTRPAFGPNVSIDRYAALTSKNIFAKNRRLPTAPTTREFRPEISRPPERRPEQTFRLTGLALQEGRNVAFIENLTSGSTERKIEGDAIAGGTIVAVDLDALEYELNGKRVRVEIGHNLAGEVASSISVAGASSSTTSTSPSTQPSGGATTPVDPNDPNLSLIERMKARRAQETGGR